MMTEPTDHELLAQFARTGAESAFAALVSRHVNLVYSAALRFTGNAHQAEEVTQAVFIILARKAGGISAKVLLTGWLYNATRLTASKSLRANFRRQQREQQAYMDSTLNRGGDASPPSDTETVWKQLAPVLDEAMNALRTADRDAVLLRYFENKPLAEVGAALGVSEDAARVRVNRALDKLRSLLAKQGVTLGATAIAGAVTANAVNAAPATLATTVTTAVLTGTGITLATVAMTTLQKIAVTAALTVTIGGGLFAAKQAHDAQAEVQTLQAQQAPMAEQIQQLQTDLAITSNRWADVLVENSRLKGNSNQNELLKLRGQIGVLQTQLADAKSGRNQIQQPPMETADEYLKRANDHEFKHEYEEQLDDLNHAIELDPTLAEAYMQRGNLYSMNLPEARGGIKQAIADYTRCLELKPNDFSARWNRAGGYRQLREYDKAIADWTIFIEGDIDFSRQLDGKVKSIAGAYFYRGEVYNWCKHDYTNAIADYTTAIQMYPNYENAHRARGQCYEVIGDTEKAQQDFAIEPK